MIEIRALNKYYNKGRQNQIHAVNNTTLTLPDSGMIAFFGKSGCGKTTLLNIIGGLDSAQSGNVIVDGENIAPTADDVRNRKIGYIFQNYNLSKQMTVYDNVASSLRLCGVKDEAEIERRVVAALHSVEMDKYRKRFPDELSGGQQQRVAIARAIVKNPDVILADEPTGNLDEHNTVMVMDLLKEISKDHLVLLVTHEQNLVDLYCSEVIEISDGKIGDRRQNQYTGGYVGKKVNDIYLGDMQRSEVDGDNLSVECFGEFGVEKMKMRLVAVGGVIYLSVPEGVKVKFADSSSEVNIHEGKFEEQEHKATFELDSMLKEPISHGKSGRIYNFKNAFKNSYTSSFGRKKRGRKALIAALVCFSMVIVLMVSLFGSVFYYSQEIKKKYNTNTVFVNSDYVKDAQDIHKLLDDGSCDNIVATYIYYTSYYNSYSDKMMSVTFGSGNFETIGHSLGIDVNSYIFPEDAMANRKKVYGDIDGLKKGEVVISKAIAKDMLASAVYEEMDSYEDLINLSGSSGSMYGGRMEMKIKGIVDGDDYAIYVNNIQYAQAMLSVRLNNDNAVILPDMVMTSRDIKLEAGEVYIRSEYIDDRSFAYSKIGSKVTILGETFTIKGFIDEYSNEIIDAAPKAVQTDTEVVIEPDGYYGYIKGLVMTEDDIVRLVSCIGKMDKIFDNSNMNTWEYGNAYYVLHAENIDGLVSILTDEYGKEALITPETIYEDLSASYRSTYIRLSVALVVIVAVMCVCLYLIMRSSIMAEVKQIGIYRAIGVSKKNIIFRYFVETCLVFSLTVFIGYAIATFGISRICSLMGETINSVLYYPAWLAGITLIGLFGASVVCGLIPVRSLLRKTPAEIISKYDI